MSISKKAQKRKMRRVNHTSPVQNKKLKVMATAIDHIKDEPEVSSRSF